MSFLSKTNKNTIFSRWLAVFVVAELLSWLFFNFSYYTWVFLAFIALLAILLSLKDSVYMIYIPLAELFWGSLGHNFEYQVFSLRLVVFLAVIFTFILKYSFRIKELKFFKDKPLLFLWLFILLLIAGGLFTAYFSGFSQADIFFDANAYFYLFYLPVWYQAYRKESLQTIINILKAAAIVLSVKTLFIFNIFVQDYKFLNIDLIYKWIRDNRTGEITPFVGGFYRIFMQSQFYILIAWFFVFLDQVRDYKDKRNFLILSFISAALLISLSRSLWLGGAVGLVFLLGNIFIYQNKHISLFVFFILFSTALSSMFLVQIFFNLPKINSFNIFQQRTVDISEPAVSSRSQLLEPMWSAIKQKPFIGYGFGKEITYQSSDPRIKTKDNPGGVYTTYSFEWGWLDQWLKAGILLVLAILAWLWLIYQRAYKIVIEDPIVIFGFGASLAALAVIHIFSPYINHPIGLGLMMLATIIFSKYAQKNYSYN